MRRILIDVPNGRRTYPVILTNKGIHMNRSDDFGEDPPIRLTLAQVILILNDFADLKLTYLNGER